MDEIISLHIMIIGDSPSANYYRGFQDNGDYLLDELLPQIMNYNCVASVEENITSPTRKSHKIMHYEFTQVFRNVQDEVRINLFLGEIRMQDLYHYLDKDSLYGMQYSMKNIAVQDFLKPILKSLGEVFLSHITFEGNNSKAIKRDVCTIYADIKKNFQDTIDLLPRKVYAESLKRPSNALFLIYGTGRLTDSAGRLLRAFHGAGQVDNLSLLTCDIMDNLVAMVSGWEKPPERIHGLLELAYDKLPRHRKSQITKALITRVMDRYPNHALLTTGWELE